MRSPQLLGQNWGNAYIYGIWWSISNMITLGSQISPANPYEVITQIVTEFVGFVFWGFAINFIMDVVSEYREMANFRK